MVARQSDAASQRDEWDDSLPSAGEAQAKALSKQEGAAKRERALAYAMSHQVSELVLENVNILKIQKEAKERRKSRINRAGEARRCWCTYNGGGFC